MILSQEKATWIRFRLLHRHSRDLYNPSAANLQRWQRHITNALANSNLKTLELDTLEINRIREVYQVASFDKFPEGTKAVYLAVAKCFPGFQVFACGSRTRGDYVDIAANGEVDNIVLNARKRAGMRFRKQSDYDFWVEPGAVQVGELPAGVDRARLRIPDNEKVAIPIWSK